MDAISYTTANSASAFWLMFKYSGCINLSSSSSG
jgi:hypothetical protein